MSFEIKKMVEEQAEIGTSLNKFVAERKAANGGKLKPEDREAFNEMEKRFNELTDDIEDKRIEERAAAVSVPQKPERQEVRYLGHKPRSSHNADLALASWLATKSNHMDTRSKGTANRELINEYGFQDQYMTVDLADGSKFSGDAVDIPTMRTAPKTLTEIRGTSAQGSGDASLGADFVPTTLSAAIDRKLLQFGNIRAVAQVIRTPGGGTYGIPQVDDTSNRSVVISEHTGDTVKDVATSKQTLSAFVLTSGIVKFSLEWDQDSQYPVMPFVTDILSERNGRGSNYYATKGAGTTEPAGVTLGAGTAVTLAHYSASPTYAELRNAHFSIDAAYRDSPSFAYMMSDSFLSYIWGIEDEFGRPLLQALTNGISDSLPMRLFGTPIYVNNQMDAPASNKKVAVVGDWSKFVIRDVGSPQLLVSRERYFEERNVAVCLVSRMDCKVINSAALKNIVTGTTG